MALAQKMLKAIRESIKKAWRALLTVALLLGVGMFLILLRALVIRNSHSIARHARTYADILTAVFTAIDFLITTIVVVLVDTIKVIADIIDKLGGRVHFNPNKPSFTVVHITTEEIETLFNNLPARCEKYDGVGTVLQKATRGWLHDSICPVIRATWPIPWLWDSTNAVLGWASYDATPIGAWTPGGDPGNCQTPDSTDWFCAGLGSGFVLVELLVPLALIIVLSPLVGPVVDIAFTVAEPEQPVEPPQETAVAKMLF